MGKQPKWCCVSMSTMSDLHGCQIQKEQTAKTVIASSNYLSNNQKTGIMWPPPCKQRQATCIGLKSAQRNASMSFSIINDTVHRGLHSLDRQKLFLLVGIRLPSIASSNFSDVWTFFPLSEMRLPAISAIPSHILHWKLTSNHIKNINTRFLWN